METGANAYSKSIDRFGTFRFRAIKLLTALLSLYHCISIPSLVAQTSQGVEPPHRKPLFTEDSKPAEKQRAQEIKQVLKTDAAPTQDFSFDAPKVEFLKEENVVKGSGGVLISGRGMQVQADQGTLNLTTKDTTLKGGVLINQPPAAIGAQTGSFNLESETGEFADADFRIDDGGYNIAAQKMSKLSETKYGLEECDFTTCSCEDKYVPWRIHTDQANITEEGYAHTYNTSVHLFKVPVFYSPYFGFPVKQERQTGLLIPEFGYGSEDGVQFKIPLFVVLDDNTDMTFTPFIETQTRTGLGVDLRKSFSKYNNLAGRVIYSNEGARDGELRGTQVSGLDDPEFDEDRFGGYYKHLWRSDPRSGYAVALASDIHYVSDDLFMREFDDPDIGDPQSRYATSKILFSSALGDFASAEILNEYNQALVDDDDLVLQRLPEVTVTGLKSFRPFGYNPYGVKLVTSGAVTATEFSRKEGYDGLRVDANPKISVPFHYKNYFNSQVQLGVRQTQYDLREEIDPNGTLTLDSSDDRTVFQAGYSISTAVERVFDVEQDSLLKNMTELGLKNQPFSLARVKHVIEPIVSYSFVPDTTQDDLPLFDSVDRIRERSLVTYGFKSRLLGRFLPRNSGAEEIPELTSRLEELPVFDVTRPLADLGDVDDFGSLREDVGIREGEIRELVVLGIKQSYDYKEDIENNEEGISAYSDVNGSLEIYPNRYFGFKYDTNYNAEDSNVSSWGIGTHFRDDRGDAIRARYSYVGNPVEDDTLSQIEGNLEVALNQRLKVGYYSRFDDQASEFIESQVLLRLISSCNCWHFDVGYSDRINPDKSVVLMSFTFKGLGDISQSVFSRRGDQSN